ncbi:AfsR/SARP family transcriptional regulator [Ilumatobacter sp.]|uniref:AfsR/SARP family transcriptional regulator n=1 Tax=Ilumatobacter sp. TaxID=1967498 RepID=UPI003C64C021
MEGPDGVIDEGDLPGHQVRIALATLALERQPVAHDTLASIVWNDAPPPRWKSALAAVVSKTRTLITSTGLDGSSVLTSSTGTYAFSPPPEMWIDLERARRSLDRAEGDLRHERTRAAASEATVASAILRRPLLPGEECRWLDDARRDKGDALYRCYVVLSSAWCRLGDHQLASGTAESAIRLDPWREVGHRLLIDAERARGDRSAALRAFERCERILADDVGVRPSPETLDLADLLRDPPRR